MEKRQIEMHPIRFSLIPNILLPLPSETDHVMIRYKQQISITIFMFVLLLLIIFVAISCNRCPRCDEDLLLMGKVTSKSTGIPIENIEVTIFDMNGNMTAQTYTNADGVYDLNFYLPWRLILRAKDTNTVIEKMLYLPTEKLVSIPLEEGILTVDISLQEIDD